MPIYALHGNLGAPSDWDRIGLDELVARNLWAESDRNFRTWAIDFCTEIPAGSENVLVGYSMGGRLTLHALIAAPDLWKRAVIVSAHPGLECPEDRLARRSSDQVWAKHARELPWEEFLQKWNAQGVLAGQEPSAAQRELESRRESVARAFENWSLGAQEDLRERLARISTPVTWVTGERDAKFSALAAEMAALMPNGEHVVLPDCGHRVLFEKPEALARLLGS
ncbi:MAG: alpha/beta fold hydrolase [Verrucomicrobiales bacterium]|nr:alpha/beta fold hydrolase [Verrucomicrobiales bacterium]